MYVTYKGEIKTKAITRSAAKQYFWGVGTMFRVIVFLVLWTCTIGHTPKGKPMFCFFIDLYCIVC